MHGDLLANDETIGYQLADRLAGVGIGDLVHLIGVEPDLALAATDDGGREALLGAEVDPGEKMWISWGTDSKIEGYAELRGF